MLFKQQLMVVMASVFLAGCLLTLPVHGHTTIDDDDVDQVHLIFMNHLDVGYSYNDLPGHIIDILNAYFNIYFPRAIKVSLDLLVLGYRERFIYTTHPWLVSLYIDCPPNMWLSGKKT